MHEFGPRHEGRGVLTTLSLVVALLFQVAPSQGSQVVPQLPLNLPRREQVRVLSPEAAPHSERIYVFYWSGGESQARRAIELLERQAPLPGLPETVPSRVLFYLAPDAVVWGFLTGGQVPDWGAGVAMPVRQMAVIPLFEAAVGGLQDRDRTILHEWAHLGLHEYLDGLRVPRWFDEGYAQRASGGWNVQEAWRLRLGLARGGAPSLDSLNLDWPRGRTGAELAYLLSGSAVEYLVSETGERGLDVFLGRWRETGDFEEAFRRTFGYTTGTFETRWTEYVRRRYGWILMLTQTAVFWAFAGLALLLLSQLRTQRNRERIAQLRASEPPSWPAYWKGPS